MSESLKRSLFERGRAACFVDEFTCDVPHNRVIKAAIRKVMCLDEVESSTRRRLRSHLRVMHEVSDVALRPEAFRAVQLHRNNSRYAFLLNICELLSRSLLPDPATGKQRFHPFTASEQQMGALFEAFVRNFLRREQTAYRISSPKVSWDAKLLEETPEGWLPEMRTDAVLEAPTERVMFEMKYYGKPFSSRHGTNKLISGHLYQLSTYLEHFPTDRPLSGLVLYAAPPSLPPQSYRIRGRELHIRSLRLDQPWPDIHRDLLGLVTFLESRAGRTAGLSVA